LFDRELATEFRTCGVNGAPYSPADHPEPRFCRVESSGWWGFPLLPDATVWDDYHAGRAAQQHPGANTDNLEVKDPLGIYG